VFEVEVRCIAGASGELEPVEVDCGRRRILVREIVDRWFGDGHRYFKLLGDDGGLYILRHDKQRDAWEITMFERTTRGAAGGRLGSRRSDVLHPLGEA
jgi:hypothetical protein